MLELGPHDVVRQLRYNFSPLLDCSCPEGLTLRCLDPSDQHGGSRGNRGWLSLKTTRRNFPQLRWKVRRSYRVKRVIIWVRSMDGSTPMPMDILPRRRGYHVMFSYYAAMAAVHICTEPA